MDGNPEFDGRSCIWRWSGSIADRVEFVPDAPHSLIDRIECGIFFVMAFWSGTSMQSFRQLVYVVQRLDVDRRLRVVVADTDRIPHLCDQPPFVNVLAGNGETFWIRSGEIVAHSGIGLNLTCYEPNTIALLVHDDSR